MRIFVRNSATNAIALAASVALLLGRSVAVANSLSAEAAFGFNADQAGGGRALYEDMCQRCHGRRLEGVTGPALAGNTVRTRWASNRRTVRDLYEIILNRMPPAAAGSLSKSQALGLVAFILSQNDYPPSDKTLTEANAAVPLGLSVQPQLSAALDRRQPKPVLPAAPPTVGEAGGNRPDDTDILAPNDANWLTFNRDYRGQRFSPLRQIDASNVHKLVPVCIFQTGEVGNFQTSPVIYDGKMYVTTPHNTYALDATNCRKLWEYQYTPDGPEPWPANRGVALYKGKLFRGTTDGHLLALDAATGELLWNAWVLDSNDGGTISGAPLAFDGKIFVGEAGADFGWPGHLHAFNAADGRRLWTFNFIPTGRERGAETWEKGAEHGGGSMWTVPTLDPVAQVLYVSIGNPFPNYEGSARPGDNLFTDSVVALDSHTGKLAWYAQQQAHDIHDWDTAAAPSIYDQDGRQYMAVASKNGWIYFYDRATHSLVSRQEVSPHVNLDKPVTAEGTRYCPGILGGVEWNGPAYDPARKSIFVGSVDWCQVLRLVTDGDDTGKDVTHVAQGFDGYDPSENAKGLMHAFDAATGKLKWIDKFDSPILAGVTPTAGGILLTGDLGGRFLAMDSGSGKLLYQFYTGASIAGGIPTYAVGGKQYVAVTSGNTSKISWKTLGAATIIIFALPQE